MKDQQVMIRTSERTLFKSCRQSWWWAYREFLKPIGAAPALEFGSLIHAALEAYYVPGRKRKGNPAKHLSRIYRQHLENGGDEIFPVKGDPTITAEDLGVEMLTNYVDEYGADEHMRIIQPEMTFQVDVHDNRGKFLYTYVGTIDGVYQNMDNKQFGFLEHKTGAGLVPFGAPLALDEQSGSYWAYAPVLLVERGLIPDVDAIDHVLFNRLRKAFADTRPVNELGQSLNKNGSVSKQQPDPLFKREFVYRSANDRIILMDRVRQEAREMRLVDEGKLKVYKNPDRHCIWCAFKDACEVHETGSDYQAIFDSMFTTWDPYSDHEIEKERRH